jgi:hypothetical protein
MVLAAAFAEGATNDWMAVAFVDGHGIDNALGVVALAAWTLVGLLVDLAVGRQFRPLTLGSSSDQGMLPRR